MKLSYIMGAPLLLLVFAYVSTVSVGGESASDDVLPTDAAPKAKLAAKWENSKYERVPGVGDGSGGGRIARASDEHATQGQGGAVILSQQPDGHFYADAGVDGGNVRFMVDTGATGIALTGDDARALGLNWSDDELRPVGRGASGVVIGKQVRLGSVSVGGFTVRNVDAVILPRGLDVSLLGQSFLSKVRSVNIQNGKMILS